MKNSQDQNEDISEQKVPPFLQNGLRLSKFRESLGFSVPEMARELQEEYKTYSNYEKGWRKVSQGCRGKLFKLGLNLNWLDTGDEKESMVLPVKEVPPGTVGGQGWNQPPEQRKAEAVRRMLEEIDRKGPTETQVWAARQIAENALRGRKLFERASQEKKEFLVDWIAAQLALGSSPEILERGVCLVLDGFEAADRQQGQ